LAIRIQLTKTRQTPKKQLHRYLEDSPFPCHLWQIFWLLILFELADFAFDHTALLQVPERETGMGLTTVIIARAVCSQ
jgi:hypothetical protein